MRIKIGELEEKRIDSEQEYSESVAELNRQITSLLSMKENL